MHRWLLYDSTSEISEPPSTNPVSLRDLETPGVKGVNTVEWLAPEMFYTMTGCAVAWARGEPPSN